MRTELYADSRDEWKWSVAIRYARQVGQSIFWVVMLRSNLGEHGNDREPVRDALPEVTAFLSQERILHDEGKPRELSNISRLCSQMGVNFVAEMASYPASLTRRGGYIAGIVGSLRAEPHDKRFVLLDPDNGIGESSHSGEQIHVAHLKQIWSVLREGDTLAIVQFQHRVADWVRALQNKIAHVLDVPVPQIRHFPFANVCLYLIDFTTAKNDGLPLVIAEIHARRRTVQMLDHCPYCGQAWRNGSFPVGWDGHAEFVCPSVADLQQHERKPAFRGRMVRDGYQLGRKRRRRG